MIGGTDTVLELPALQTDPSIVLLACLRHWPDSMSQSADGDTLHLVRDIVARPQAKALGPEFIVYRDQASAESWIEHGATPDNAGTMLHFLYSSDSPSATRLTIVSDCGSKDAEAIEDTIRRLVDQPRTIQAVSSH